MGTVAPVGTRPPANRDPDVPRPIEPFNLILSMAMPQPIWNPVSSVPPPSVVEPSPFTEPVNVAPTRYSRDDTAVVSGATGNCDSSAAVTVSAQPSGVLTI